MARFMTLSVWKEDGAEFASADGYDTELRPLTWGDDPIGGTLQPGLWWAQYSASGYLDHTDPVCGDDAAAAARECFAAFGDDESQEDRDELASVLWEIRKGRRP